MSVLNRDDIIARMKQDSANEKRIIVTPLLNIDQIGPASIDVRLGSSIIVPRKTYIDQYDMTQPVAAKQFEQRANEKRKLKYNSKFVLHPNQLILGSTFEYICLPSDIYSTIMSRSSWGRLGLVVATAAAVQPGYKGCLTLELVNLSESPISLYPGLPVGQLVFYSIEAKGGYQTYSGRYTCPTEAELPKFFAKESDHELIFWGSKTNPS